MSSTPTWTGHNDDEYHDWLAASPLDVNQEKTKADSRRVGMSSILTIPARHKN
jgi:hypothetical protein